MYHHFKHARDHYECTKCGTVADYPSPTLGCDGPPAMEHVAPVSTGTRVTSELIIDRTGYTGWDDWRARRNVPTITPPEWGGPQGTEHW